ncbi:hypothetical protein C8F01DRAFT_568587 [Mycena amicta]|nr:hypothetical protein C8F01DRAFT_568587 [Mycena amicta]
MFASLLILVIDRFLCFFQLAKYLHIVQAAPCIKSFQATEISISRSGMLRNMHPDPCYQEEASRRSQSLCPPDEPMTFRPRIFSLPSTHSALSFSGHASNKLTTALESQTRKRKAEVQLSKEDSFAEEAVVDGAFPRPKKISPIRIPRRQVFYPPVRATKSTPSSEDDEGDEEPYRLIPSLYERFPRLRDADFYDGHWLDNAANEDDVMDCMFEGN